MRHFTAVVCRILTLGAVLLALGACGTPSGAAPTASVSPIRPTTEASSFHDSFAYCAAVGTIDAPDVRYTGDKLPDFLVQGMIRKGIVTADAPPAIQQNAVWRCMQGHVWVCHFGANLPCQEKADTSRAPTTEMTAYCATRTIREIATTFSLHMCACSALSYSPICMTGSTPLMGTSIMYFLIPVQPRSTGDPSD